MKQQSRRVIAVLMTGLATAAIAHEGVQNPAVMARMEGMSAIAESLKVMGQMANGQTGFDADQARAAAAAIAGHAAEINTLFEPREDDPKSEALPVIWERFDDFSMLALELEDLARAASGSITTFDDLAPVLSGFARNCRACHATFRQ